MNPPIIARVLLRRRVALPEEQHEKQGWLCRSLRLACCAGCSTCIVRAGKRRSGVSLGWPACVNLQAVARVHFVRSIHTHIVRIVSTKQGTFENGLASNTPSLFGALGRHPAFQRARCCTRQCFCALWPGFLDMHVNAAGSRRSSGHGAAPAQPSPASPRLQKA